MSKDFINGIYGQFPENDFFDSSVQFDSFLTGDGSNQIYLKKEPKQSFFESFTESGEFGFDIINDLDQFAVSDFLVEDFEDFFFKCKKEYLTRFNFLEEKSKKLQGVPVRERDLVLNSDDSYLLHHVKSQSCHFKFILEALAHLSACLDMGVDEVKFFSVDDCPLCEAYEGTVFSVKDLISRIGSNKLVLHAGAQYNFVPVIRDRKYFGHIQNGLTVSAYIDQVFFRNLPLEWVDFITSDLVFKIPNKEVCFIDFEILSSMVPTLEVESDEVVLSYEDFLFVRNTYVLNYSPYEFLINWLDSKDDSDLKKLESVNDQEVLYLNGRKVMEHNGKYVDIQTKEIVNE